MITLREWAAHYSTLVERDLRLALRHRSEAANPLLFFVIVTSLFPLAVSPEPETLRVLAPGVVWIAALLATLLSLESMFRSDFEDGSLEQMLVSPRPLLLVVAAKVSAHWLLTGLPLIAVSPLLAAVMGLPAPVLPVVVASLALGTPVLSLVGAIGVALTVGIPRGGALLSLLLLPLYVPVLVFGAGAISNGVLGLGVSGPLLMLSAFLVLAGTLAPLAAGAALRVALS